MQLGMCWVLRSSVATCIRTARRRPSAGPCWCHSYSKHSGIVITIHHAAPQIKCGDLYEDGAVQTFNACAVSDKKCVPQRVDEGVYPVRNIQKPAELEHTLMQLRAAACG